MKTDELMAMADSLPLDIKTQLIDKLLNSLNPTTKEIDELWAIEAERRVEEIKTGKVEPIPGEEVFKEIRENLSK
jgi:putative addiction module component (TIGR02574 family)